MSFKIQKRLQMNAFIEKQQNGANVLQRYFFFFSQSSNKQAVVTHVNREKVKRTCLSAHLILEYSADPHHIVRM